MVSTAVTCLLWRGRMRWTWTIAAGFAVALAAAPYVIYVMQYGSPTPETLAQIALIETGARAAGWTDLPRKSFPDYLAHFIVAFIRDWMPALGTWSAFNYTMFAVPVAALAGAVAGFAASLRRLWCRAETTLEVVVLSGALALTATFALHVGYSYGRHLATGWLLGRLSALLLAARRDCAARGPVAPRRDRNSALARRIADIPHRRPGSLPHLRRAVRLGLTPWRMS
ncbi:MAG: hypothetical protein ABSD08_03575 [Xanthobacteraceae bacterium]